MRALISLPAISSLAAFLSPVASPIFSTSNIRTPLASRLSAAISVSGSTTASRDETEFVFYEGARHGGRPISTGLIGLGDFLDLTRTHSLLLERRQRQRHGPAHAAPAEDFPSRNAPHHRHGRLRPHRHARSPPRTSQAPGRIDRPPASRSLHPSAMRQSRLRSTRGRSPSHSLRPGRPQSSLRRHLSRRPPCLSRKKSRPHRHGCALPHLEARHARTDPVFPRPAFPRRRSLHRYQGSRPQLRWPRTRGILLPRSSRQRRPLRRKRRIPYVRLRWPHLSRSEEHTSELQSLRHLVCRLLLEKKKKNDPHKLINQRDF